MTASEDAGHINPPVLICHHRFSVALNRRMIYIRTDTSHAPFTQHGRGAGGIGAEVRRNIACLVG